MMVEVKNPDDNHYGLRVKVHGFNCKGVLVGNIYEFVSYDKIRVPVSEGEIYNYPRYFMDKKGEKIKMFLFKIILCITSKLIKFCEKYICT